MAVNWLDGEGIFSSEKLSPGRHITPNDWRAEFGFWQPHYDYISDYECVFDCPYNPFYPCYNGVRWQRLQQAKQLGTNISIVDLVHNTNELSAAAINESDGFKGGLQKINEILGVDERERFSWWSVDAENDVDLVRGHMQSVINPFLNADDYSRKSVIRNQFATSNAFSPYSRYGRVCFQYSITDMCTSYRDCIGEKLRFKVLGTYMYKQEIMHAVVICGESAACLRFPDYLYPNVLTPDLDVDNTTIVTRDNDGNWIWKPHATATEIVRLDRFWQSYPRYRRWDNLAFAFHLPSEDHVIPMPLSTMPLPSMPLATG